MFVDGFDPVARYSPHELLNVDHNTVARATSSDREEPM